MKRFIIRDAEIRENCVRYLQGLGLDQPWEVVIQPFKKNRTSQANRRHWALMTQISQQMPPHMDGVWHAPEVWHAFFCRQFLGVEVMRMDGREIPVRKSSAKLNTAQFSDLDTQIEAWAAEHGLVFEDQSHWYA